jgi:hypothetical protein
MSNSSPFVIARSQRVRPSRAGPMTGSATKQSIAPQVKRWIASLPATHKALRRTPTRRSSRSERRRVARNDEGTLSHSRDTKRVRVLRHSRPSRREGAGNAGRWPHPQPGVAKETNHSGIVTTGKAERSALPAQWLYGCSVISPVNRLFCHRRPGLFDPGVVPGIGGTGPHGLTVRLSAHRLRANGVHRIPHSTFVTIATRPQ